MGQRGMSTHSVPCPICNVEFKSKGIAKHIKSCMEKHRESQRTDQYLNELLNIWASCSVAGKPLLTFQQTVQLKHTLGADREPVWGPSECRYQVIIISVHGPYAPETGGSGDTGRDHDLTTAVDDELTALDDVYAMEDFGPGQ